MKKSILMIMSVGLIFILTLYSAGCGNKPKETSGDKKVVARINNYAMTISDFDEEARLISGSKYYLQDPAKAKEGLLNELIKKQVLIQEAQRQNFDKDVAFMNEIERYWEQALLKLLIKKKIKELSVGIKAVNDEERQDRVSEALDAWIQGLCDKANIKIYKENLKET